MIEVDFPKSGGLCNRLKGLVSLFQLFPEDKLSLYWPEVVRMDYKRRIDFDWFLDNQIVLRDSPKSSIEGDWESINSLKRLYVTEEDVPGTFAQFNPIIKEGIKRPCIDFEYERIPQKVRNRILPYFKQLKFKKEIEQFEECSIAVHIRNDKLWTMSNNSQLLNNYFKAIDQLNPDKFLAVTHTAHDLEHLIRRYGNKVIKIPNPIYDGNDKKFIQHCVSKILVLSKCSTVVIDRKSSIPEVAWWLGNCKFKPIFVQGRKGWRE